MFQFQTELLLNWCLQDLLQSTLKGPSQNVFTNIKSGRILCIKETEDMVI